MVTINREPIGSVVLRIGGAMAITSIIDSSDSQGRTTTARLANGDIYVRLINKRGAIKFFQLINDALMPSSNVKAFNLE